MTTRSLVAAGIAAFGLALFGFGQLVQEPERRVAAEPVSAVSANVAEPWKLWNPKADPPEVAAPANAAADAGVWSTPAEWAEPD